MEPKRFYVASGPTGARIYLTELITEALDGRIAGRVWETHKDENYAGTHTDYRYELKLALEYALAKPENGLPTIYSHSLIDSLAYITLKVERFNKFKSVSQYTLDKELLTLGVVGAMFKDSFKADHIIFLEMWEKDSDEGRIQERVRAILDEFELPYTVLNGEDSAEQWLDQAVAVIEARLGEDGSGHTDSEPLATED